MERSDTQIREHIDELLRNTSWVDAKEFQVEVRGGTATLTGTVDSALEKRRARELVESAEGVKDVADNLQVRNFVKRPDNELAEEVRHALLRDAYVGKAAIEVYASNGEIRLDGEVPTYAVRKAAADVAWWVPGVINVENLLLVTDEEFVDVSPGEVVDAG